MKFNIVQPVFWWFSWNKQNQTRSIKMKFQNHHRTRFNYEDYHDWQKFIEWTLKCSLNLLTDAHLFFLWSIQSEFFYFILNRDEFECINRMQIKKYDLSNIASKMKYLMIYSRQIALYFWFLIVLIKISRNFGNWWIVYI